MEQFLQASESMEKLHVPKPKTAVSHHDIAESIYRILCDDRIGPKQNEKNNNCEQFVESLMPTLENRSRLLFVLPGFPFKDQNMFRVPFGSDKPDLADMSLMIRLHRLTQAIDQVHPYGADVLVLFDGALYCELFGVPAAMASLYGQRLISYRNRLNL